MAKVGKPLKYRSSKEFKDKVNEYFATNAGSLTLSGLILSIGFCSRQSWYEYEKTGEYGDICKTARLRLEEYYEKLLVLLKNPGGPIFWLKNAGWTDQQQIEHSGTISNIVRFPLKSPVGAPVDGVESNS